MALRTTIAGHEPRLYSVGVRFRDGRGVPPLAEVRRRLVVDGREAPTGAFSLVRFRLDEQLSRVMGRVDPAALEGRLVHAAHDALRDRVGWAQGVLHVSHREGPGHASPEVAALLSAKRSDGGPARLLGPVDVQRLEASWYAHSHDAMGVTRELPAFDRQSPDRALAEAGPLRTISLSVDGGGRYLAPLDADERREALRLAVESVGRQIGLANVGAAHWERGESGSLRLLVFYNQADHSIDRASVERAFSERLGVALEEEARRYRRWAPGERLPGVQVNRDLPSRQPSADTRTSQLAARTPTEGRPAVRFRLEDGRRQLGPFSEQQKEQILDRAARRAFPGAWGNGSSPQMDARLDGAAAIVRVYLPAEMSGRWPDLFPAPEAQARFRNEVYRAAAEQAGKA